MSRRLLKDSCRSETLSSQSSNLRSSQLNAVSSFNSSSRPASCSVFGGRLCNAARGSNGTSTTDETAVHRATLTSRFIVPRPRSNKSAKAEFGMDSSVSLSPPDLTHTLIVPRCENDRRHGVKQKRDTKTAWEGVVMVVGDDVAVLRLEGTLIHVVFRENATNQS